LRRVSIPLLLTALIAVAPVGAIAADALVPGTSPPPRPHVHRTTHASQPPVVPGTSPLPTSLVPGSPPPTPSSTLGVPLGAGVTVRLSPDNNIISAVQQAVLRVGLGPVEVLKFTPDCSPLQGRVVVCRDIALQQTGDRAATTVGYGTCVVSLDPRVGGAAVGVNIVTRALRKCIAA